MPPGSTEDGIIIEDTWEDLGLSGVAQIVGQQWSVSVPLDLPDAWRIPVFPHP